MAACFWYLVNRDLSSVCYCKVAHASVNLCTRTTRLCLSGQDIGHPKKFGGGGQSGVKAIALIKIDKIYGNSTGSV